MESIVIDGAGLEKVGEFSEALGNGSDDTNYDSTDSELDGKEYLMRKLRCGFTAL